jgi:hypothetical protein
MAFTIIVDNGIKYIQDSTDNSRVPVTAPLDLQNGSSVRLVEVQENLLAAIKTKLDALDINAANSEAGKLDLLIQGIGGLAVYLSSIDQSLGGVQGVVTASDVVESRTYLDAGSINERIHIVTYSSASLDQIVTETYSYAGSDGNYRVAGINRSLAAIP